MARLYEIGPSKMKNHIIFTYYFQHTVVLIGNTTRDHVKTVMFDFDVSLTSLPASSP